MLIYHRKHFLLSSCCMTVRFESLNDNPHKHLLMTGRMQLPLVYFPYAHLIQT